MIAELHGQMQQSEKLDRIILACAKQRVTGRWTNLEDIGYGG